MTSEQKRKHEWYLRNKGLVIERTLQWQKDNPEKLREQSRVRMQTYRAANEEKFRARTRKWRADNPQKVRELGKKYRLKSPDKVRERLKDWIKRNPDKHRETRKRRRAKNLKRILEQGRQWREKNREKIRARMRVWHKTRRAEDLSFRVLGNTRNRLRLALKNCWKSGSTSQLLGCTILELRAHLEALFVPGMTWENYGPVWHVDHKRPCASFDLSDPAQQRLCFHFTNLQPLFALDNIKKGAKYAEV